MFAREDGQTIVEYALVLGAISLVLIIALAGSGILDEFAELAGDLTPFLGG
jgi:Flp pilus assembly pilin Flp